MRLNSCNGKYFEILLFAFAKKIINRQTFSIPAYNAGKGSTNQALVYQHMSNHYRRVLNAKKAVDASPPRHYKPRCTTSTSPSPVRSFSPSKKLVSRNASPSPTERSISSNSYGGSCWATESCASKKQHLSRHCEGRRGPTRSDMELVNRIAYDTKYGPAAYW